MSDEDWLDYDDIWSNDHTSLVNDLFEGFESKREVSHRIYYPFCKVLFLLLVLDRQ